MRKQLAASAAALALAIPLAGCGGDQQYYPAAYGENGHCYYVQDPYEAQQLMAQGLCPSGWTPYPMPLAWHERYAPYYGSNAYAGKYVRPAKKAGFLAAATAFYKSHKSQIKQLEKQAVYKLKNGKTTKPCAAGPLELLDHPAELSAYVAKGGGGGHGGGSHGSGSHGSGSKGSSGKTSKIGGSSGKGSSSSGKGAAGSAKGDSKTGKVTSKPC